MLSAPTPIFRNASPTGSAGPGIGAGSVSTSGGCAPRGGGAPWAGPTPAGGWRAQAPLDASTAKRTASGAHRAGDDGLIEDGATLAREVANVIAAAAWARECAPSSSS